MKHIFFIPSSYAALIYAMLTAAGLLTCLFVGVIMHSEVLLGSHCGPDHYEYWPSISSAIGDGMPERQLWRISFILCTPFRLGASITLFSVFWQKATGGLGDLRIARSSPRLFLQSSAFLTLLLLWADLWRLIFAVVWTMVASYENLSYHNIGFCPYVFLCFVLQITAVFLVRRNRYNLSIYPNQRDAHMSYFIKKICLWGQSIASVGVALFFWYHRATCADGSFSLSTMCEWCFAFFNIGFDASCWFELATEGWWFSGSPSFYKQLIGQYARRVVSGGGKSTAIADGSAMAAAGVAIREESKDKRMPGEMPALAAVQRTSGSAEESAAVVDMSGGASSTAPLNLPPRTDGGEPFFADDVVLHRFTFCCAPSSLTMWLCDIYWAHLFSEMSVHLVQHMYFQPLVAMSVSWEVVSVLVLGVACLLRVGRFRRWARGPCFFARTLLKPAHPPIGTSNRVVPMYVFFYFCASLTHLHMLFTRNVGHKILGVAAGPLFLGLAIFTRTLYPGPTGKSAALLEDGEDMRRVVYAFPLGLIMVMLLRILYISQSPMYVEPLYSFVFGVLLGLGFTTIIYRHVMFGNNSHPAGASSGSAAGGSAGASAVGDAAGGGSDSGEAAAVVEKEDGGADPARKVHFDMGKNSEAGRTNTYAQLAASYPAVRPGLLGLLFGVVMSISSTFFIAPGYIPRLVAVEPYPASFFVVAAFALGVFYSTDVLPICAAILPVSRTRSSAVSRFLSSRLAFNQSWTRFGIVMAAGTLFLLFGTRQTNFAFEKVHADYPVSFETPREKVLIKHWDAQMSFAGNRYAALLGGLVMVFCCGVLYPIAMELCLVHQAVRRQMRVDDSLDVEAALRAEGSFFTSFEFCYFAGMVVFILPYVLAISYPFIPLGFLFREQSRPTVIFNMAGVFGLTLVLCRRMRNVRMTAVSDTTIARRQRTMHHFIAALIPLAFLLVFIGRTALQPDDVGYPAGKTTALRYPDEVLRLHNLLIEMRVRRNNITDPQNLRFQNDYTMGVFNHDMDELARNVTETEDSRYVRPEYGLQHLSKEERGEVMAAARAMTFFSGLIWTVHFGLDNYDVDSFARMAHHARRTEVGVVGLLESDSMHLTNGNRDMVEYMAYYMGFPYTDYGPTALDNTYGCALISRYPIRSVRRYVIPSPLGELACTIHAELDVYGATVHTYVGHFGNTEHWADGLLQSQFLGRLVETNPGPSMWLGYLVTHVGNPERYGRYADPEAPGRFRDAGLEMYTRHPWVRLRERGGYEEPPPPPRVYKPGDSTDFDVEYKLQQPYVQQLEASQFKGTIDASFRRTPSNETVRQFHYLDTNRYTDAHPRFEFLDRYCQYCLFKTGAARDELPVNREAVARNVFDVQLFDWWRITKPPESDLSDTEIQVIQLRFTKHDQS